MAIFSQLKKLMITAGICIFVLGAFKQDVMAYAGPSEIIPDIIIEGDYVQDTVRWEYKFENGFIYRRKYSITRQKYLTDWELVGPIKKG